MLGRSAAPSPVPTCSSTRANAEPSTTSAVEPHELSEARKELRDLLKPGMRRLHMVKERDPLRDKILGTLTGALLDEALTPLQQTTAEAEAHPRPVRGG